MRPHRAPQDLSQEERQRLHRAHQRLRNASQALEALTVVVPMRGRWDARPAPAEAVAAASADLQQAVEEVWQAQRELLHWAPPGTH